MIEETAGTPHKHMVTHNGEVVAYACQYPGSSKWDVLVVDGWFQFASAYDAKRLIRAIDKLLATDTVTTLQAHEVDQASLGTHWISSDHSVQYEVRGDGWYYRITDYCPWLRCGARRPTSSSFPLTLKKSK